MVLGVARHTGVFKSINNGMQLNKIDCERFLNPRPLMKNRATTLLCSKKPQKHRPLCESIHNRKTIRAL